MRFFSIVRTRELTAYKSKKDAQSALKWLSGMFPAARLRLVMSQSEEEVEPAEKIADETFINALGDQLKTLRDKKERVLELQILPPDFEVADGSFKATVSDGEFQGSFTGQDLHSAIYGARKRMAAAREAITPTLIEVPVDAPVVPPAPKKSAAGLTLRKKV